MIRSNQKHKNKDVSRETSRKKGTRKKNGKTRGPRAFFLFAVAVLALLNLVALNDAVVSIRTADVFVNDLPAPFDGTRILYLSDPEINGLRSLDRFGRLCGDLSPLSPDIAVVSGTLVKPGLLFRLIHPNASESDLYAGFFEKLAGIAAAGHVAVRGESDAAPSATNALASQSGVRLLDNDAFELTSAGRRVIIAGLSSGAPDVNGLAGRFPSDACVLCFADRADLKTLVDISEASGGGMWCDLLCAGPASKGRLLIAENTLRYEKGSGISGGWREEVYPMLASSSCATGLTQRSPFSRAEVWLITLRRG